MISIAKLGKHIPKPSILFEEIFDKDTKLFSFDINCNDLPKPDYITDKVDYVSQLIGIIEILNTVEKPCLYWFEAESIEDANKINNLLNDYRAIESEKEKGNRRVVPVKNSYHNNNPIADSKYIYVGKRHEGVRKKDGLTNISGRIAIHFGYYKKGSTQGLQLAHWAQVYQGKLKLNVLELSIEAKDYLEILEKLLAKKLKPLCGRH